MLRTLTGSSQQRTGIWLGFLFSLLFFAFPVALGLANLTTLLILITGLYLLSKPEVRSEILVNRMVWLLAALYGVIVLGLFYSPADWYWKSIHLDKYAKLLYAALMLVLLIAYPRVQILALNAFVAAMFFIVVSTWLNIWFLLPWSVTQNLGWGETHHVFGDHITQNVMMSFFCALALHRAIQSADIFHRFFWWLLTLAAAISITHLSTGRTGYILLLASLLTYVFVATKGRWAWIASLLVLLAGGIAAASSSTLQTRFNQAWDEFKSSQTNNQTSIGHRLYNYTVTPKLIAEKPIFGHGTGAYHEEICRHVERKDQCDSFSWHPHNQFLFFAAGHGIFGLGLFVAIIFYMYLLSYRSQALTIRTMMASLASILLVNSMFNSSLWSSRESHFFLYMLALLAAMAYTHAKHTQSSNPQVAVGGE